MEDYGVSKKASIVILDSLINSSISRSLVLNTDNVIVSPCIIHSDSSLEEIDISNVSDKDRRILKRLGIVFPDENSLSSFGCSADLVLFIRSMELDINYDVKLSGLGTPVPVVTPQNRYEFVAEDVAFVIWDYRKNNIVCSGKIDASAFASRCSQIMTESAKKAGLKSCNNKESFWPFLLSSIGEGIAKATPFSKNSIDSIMNDEEWRRMKERQLVHPQRDSAIIASKLEAIYPQLAKVIDDIATSLGSRQSVQLGLTISPQGNIFSARMMDSIKIDSAATAKLNTDISGAICDSIANPKLFTIATIKIEMKNAKDRIRIVSVKNVELRSKAGIMRKVMKELANIRYAYNRRLRDGMDKDGKITVKFAINEYGKVVHSAIVSSTMNDLKLEQETVSIIKAWKFDRIYNPGDVCEVIYPFVFSR